VIPPTRGRTVVIEAQADIQPSAEDVLDYCSDPTNEPGWTLKMTTVEQLTEGPSAWALATGWVQLGAEGPFGPPRGFGIGR
jgi:uncharacterized membrane protein